MRAHDTKIGKSIGAKYRLQEVLGLGGMGLVYGARHQATGRAVAIKLLRSELLTRPELVRRVSREARLAVEAAHPNVVEVLDAGTDDEGVPYLVLERLYGTPLDALIGEPLSLLATVQALMPVVNALLSLHRVGIVHRDIKPSNIFLDRGADGRITPKLLDFGLAKALEADGSTLSGIAVGTPAYMAPEQALGCSAVGPATDVWSMAVVFVHCLTGRLPFAGTAASSLASLRLGLNPEDLAAVPTAVARVLARALQLDPGARPADMLALRTELLTALELVDAAIQWPNDATISYSAEESDLGLAARARGASVEAEPVAGDASEPLRARHLDLETRTLSNVSKRGIAPRARRVLRWSLPFGVAGLGAFVFSAGQGLVGAAPELAAPLALQGMSGPAIPTRDLVENHGAFVDSREQQFSRSPDSGDEPRTLALDPGLDRSQAKPVQRDGPLSSSSSRRRLDKPAVRLAPALSPERNAPTAEARALGANRSPIIE